jgi:adenylate cyclase
MKLFDKTLSGFSSYLDQYDKRAISKGVDSHGGLRSIRNMSEHFERSLTDQKSPLIINFKEEDLSRFFSPSPLRFKTISIGDHPDFKAIGHHETTKHYAVSLFMDIKGSTGLIEVVQDLEELRRLKDTILTLAINVCNYFGGHVQRLQGDGIFVLFTRKGHEPNDAIIGALNASSLLTYFVKYELAPELTRIGIEKPIRIRTGIDYGATPDVLWSRYGIVGCNELTTTSVHTDLAAKLQQRANSNGVIIGDNVREALDLDGKYLSSRTYTENGNLKEEKAIRVSSSFNYPMWLFDWEKFLLSYSCCIRTNGKIEFNRPMKRLRCIRQDNGFEYFENSYALEKGIKVKFEILNQHGSLLINDPPKKIGWKIVNTGKEATKESKTILPVAESENQTSVIVDTVYLGQHKMQCTIGNVISNDLLEFHVFVRPDKLLSA